MDSRSFTFGKSAFSDSIISVNRPFDVFPRGFPWQKPTREASREKMAQQPRNKGPSETRAATWSNGLEITRFQAKLSDEITARGQKSTAESDVVAAIGTSILVAGAVS